MNYLECLAYISLTVHAILGAIVTVAACIKKAADLEEE